MASQNLVRIKTWPQKQLQPGKLGDTTYLARVYIFLAGKNGMKRYMYAINGSHDTSLYQQVG